MSYSSSSNYSSSSSNSSSSSSSSSREIPVSSSSSSFSSSSSSSQREPPSPVNMSIQLKMQNIMATVNLGCRVELDKITQTVRNAEYNPKRFQAVIMRIREPRTTALIFASGKMIVTGARSETDAMNAGKKYTAIIQKVGFAVQFGDFKIQNITATCDCGFPIRIEALCYANQSNSTYEPELFPGLVYRMTDPKVVMLIFVSGKIVLTGARSIDALTLAFTKMHPKFIEYRKKNLVVVSKQTRIVPQLLSNSVASVAGSTGKRKAKEQGAKPSSSSSSGKISRK